MLVSQVLLLVFVLTYRIHQVLQYVSQSCLWSSHWRSKDTTTRDGCSDSSWCDALALNKKLNYVVLLSSTAISFKLQNYANSRFRYSDHSEEVTMTLPLESQSRHRMLWCCTDGCSARNMSLFSSFQVLDEAAESSAHDTLRLFASRWKVFQRGKLRLKGVSRSAVDPSALSFSIAVFISVLARACWIAEPSRSFQSSGFAAAGRCCEMKRTPWSSARDASTPIVLSALAFSVIGSTLVSTWLRLGNCDRH